VSLIESLPRLRRWRIPRADGLVQWIVPLVILLVWQAACVGGLVPARVLPAPSAVALAGWKLLSSGELARNVSVSFWRAGVGFVIGGSIGFGFGLANGLSQLSSRLTDTTLQMVRNIPHLALIPLVILWFGIGEPSKVATIALGVFFPTVISAYSACDSVPRNLIRMGQSFGLPATDIVAKIVLPGAMPGILAGFRISASVALLLLVAAEMIGAQYGIGAFVLTAGNLMQTDQLLAGVVVLSILGLLISWGLGTVERSVLRWR